MTAFSIFVDPPPKYAFAPQAATLVRGHTLSADTVMFAFDPQSATAVPTISPVSVTPLDIPEFDRQSAWSVDFNGVNDLIWFAGYTPIRGAFLVRYTDGAFTLWLGMPQGVMRGLINATNQRQFLHNLGRPFLASFYP